MKKVLVLALATAAVVACQKTENDSTNTPDAMAREMSVVTSVKGNPEGKALIDGGSMPSGSTLGVHMLKSTDVTAAYPAATGSLVSNYTDATNIQFVLKGATAWSCVTPAGDPAKFYLSLFKTTAPAPEDVDYQGKAFAYAPYATTVTGLDVAATIPVSTLPSGTIEVTPGALKGAFASAKEIDYLYSGAIDAANYVDKSKPTVNFHMKHAMARVSFVVTKDATNVPQEVYFKSFAIHANSLKGAALTKATMNLQDGALVGTEPATFDRLITGYKIVANPATIPATLPELEQLVWVGLAVVPATGFDDAANSLKGVFQIGTDPADANEGGSYNVDFTTNNPVTEWKAGKHYVYHIVLNSMSSLQVAKVTVEPWGNILGGSGSID